MNLYPNCEDIDYSTAIPLNDSQQDEFRQALRQRADRVFKGLLICAVLTIPLVISPFFFALWAWIAKKRYLHLAEVGVFIPAVMIAPHGKRIDPTSIVDMHRTYEEVKMHSFAGNTSEAGTAMNAANGIQIALAGFVPCLVAHMQFETEGKQIQVSRPAFANDIPYADAQGFSVVLHLPHKPRRCWLVSLPK